MIILLVRGTVTPLKKFQELEQGKTRPKKCSVCGVEKNWLKVCSYALGIVCIGQTSSKVKRTIFGAPLVPRIRKLKFRFKVDESLCVAIEFGSSVIGNLEHELRRNVGLHGREKCLGKIEEKRREVS